jgi:gas vesicle protein
MLRFRFSSGVLLGLIVGVPAGALCVLLIAPGGAHEPNRQTQLQVEELTRRLESAKEEREQADKQLERFQKLAEQMTTTFNTLEARFRALEDAERTRQTEHAPPLPAERSHSTGSPSGGDGNPAAPEGAPDAGPQ